MSDNLPPDLLRKINEAVDDFTQKHGEKNLKPGTSEWEAAVKQAIEDHKLDQADRLFRKELVELEKRLQAKLATPLVCRRDGDSRKCKEGPWYGAGCLLCKKEKGGKLGAPGSEVFATR